MRGSQYSADVAGVLWFLKFNGEDQSRKCGAAGIEGSHAYI